MHGSREASHASGKAVASQRLDSWKAIAAYLNRDVSTVRRWEKREGLPVHRHLHNKLGSVYAIASEIDAWREKRAFDGLSPPDPTAIEHVATAEASGSEARSVSWLAVAVLMVLAGLSVLAIGDRVSRTGSGSATPFVAVMPLHIDTGMDDTAADILTDSITRGLAASPGFKVISRTSAFRYKGRSVVPRKVGSELGGVKSLLMGRIRQDSSRVRLSIELIDADADRQLWSRTYEVPADATLSLSAHVVRDVVFAMTGRVAPGINRYALNGSAYELYLRGRHHWYKRTPEGLSRAAALFSRAIEQDPAFAPAYAGLADTYTLMGYYAHMMPFEEARAKARFAAVRALTLDDGLAEAHTSMASVLEFERWDWAGAEREYKRAIELAPNYAGAYHWYANNLSIRGRHDEAIAQVSQAVELDPLSPIMRVALGHAYLLAGRDAEAIAQLRDALEIEPAFANARLFLGMALQRQGRYDEARAEMEWAVSAVENWVWNAFLADLYMRMRRADDARRIVDRFEARRPELSAVTRAALYAAVRERDRALALLKQACDRRDPDIGFLTSIPAFDILRGDPEFQTLLRRTGLS